jgi:hypothetical protein
VLAEALTLNDSLQYAIAKHEAIALGNLPPEPAPVVPSPVVPSPVVPSPVAPTPVVEETKPEEDEDDEFAQIAQRCSLRTFNLFSFKGTIFCVIKFLILSGSQKIKRKGG